MKRFVLSVMLMLGLVVTPMVAVAQPTARDTSFQSALSGDVIDLGTSGEITFVAENYELNEGRTVSEEYIWFTYGWSNFELVIVDGEIQAQEYYDLTMGNMVEFYDVFEVIDESVGADHAWFLANAEYQGNTMLVYYDYQLDALGDFDLLVMQFSPVGALGMDMGFVQQEVTVGNQPLLPNADALELEALANGDAPAGNTTETTPESGSGTGNGVTERTGRIGDSGTGEATAESTEAAGTTRATRTTSPAEPTEAAGTTSSTRTSRTTTAAEPTEPAAGDWESMGLVSDTEWVSPQFQTNVTWDGGMWVFPADYDRAIVTSADPLYDVIILETVDGEGFVFVSIEEAGAETPDSFADYWESPDFAATFEQEVSIVEISTTVDTATVIYETVTSSGNPLFIVYTATFMGDGTVVMTRIVSDSAGIASVYGQFVDGVQVNGAPLTLNYTVEEIATLSGN